MVNIIEPISEPTKILGIGLNYTDGADEMVKKDIYHDKQI